MLQALKRIFKNNGFVSLPLIIVSVFVIVSIFSISTKALALTADDISLFLSSGLITQEQATALSNSINNLTPTIIVTSPDSGQNLILGNFYNITWQSANLPSDDLTTVSLENGAGALICSLGQVPTSWNQMQFDLSKSSCYKDNTKIDIASGQYKIWLNSSSGAVGRSADYFTISSIAIPVINSFHPLSGAIGTQFQVYGTNLSGITSVTLTQRSSGGTSYPVEWSPTSDTQIGIAIPSIPSGDYLINACSSSGCSGVLSAENSPVFTITSPSSIRVLSPNGGEQLFGGKTYNVQVGAEFNPSTSYKQLALCNEQKQSLGDLAGSWLNNGTYSWEVGRLEISKGVFSTVTIGSGYCIKAQILSNSGTELASDFSDGSFTISAPQQTCTQSTSCVSQSCQYGGDLKKCTAKKSDCSVSSYTTGSCTSAPSNHSTCDSTAQSIVDSVGGCSSIDQSLYSNIYNVCCVTVIVTKESLLSLLNTALADGFINSQEKSSLLSALNSYLK